MEEVPPVNWLFYPWGGGMPTCPQGPESQKKKEPAGPPPPSDLETEDMLIKKAIELSLQFSPPLADHCSGSSR